MVGVDENCCGGPGGILNNDVRDYNSHIVYTTQRFIFFLFQRFRVYFFLREFIKSIIASTKKDVVSNTRKKARK